MDAAARESNARSAPSPFQVTCAQKQPDSTQCGDAVLPLYYRCEIPETRTQCDKRMRVRFNQDSGARLRRLRTARFVALAATCSSTFVVSAPTTPADSSIVFD